jgi:hypothetical protein
MATAGEVDAATEPAAEEAAAVAEAGEAAAE